MTAKESGKSKGIGAGSEVAPRSVRKTELLRSAYAGLLVLGLVLLPLMSAKAQAQQSDQALTWAQTSDPSQASAESKSKTTGNYTVNQSLEFGYRDSLINGNIANYDTFENLGSGLRLFNYTVDMHSINHQGPFFDNLTFSNFGYGGDPNDVSRLRVNKDKWYDFRAIRVTHYNGLADDPEVTVDAFIAANPFSTLSKPQESDASTTTADASAEGGAAGPKWDGTDVWDLASDSVNQTAFSGGQLKAVAENTGAYVAGGKLVAGLGSASLRLIVGLTTLTTVNLTMKLSQSTLVCDVVQTKVGHWGFALKNCTLAGRWAANDIIHQLSHFPDPSNLTKPVPLCTSNGSYCGIKKTICGLSDVTAQLGSPTDQCDALSMGVAFNTVPGYLGNVYDVVQVGELCPQGSQPSKDDCEIYSSLTDPNKCTDDAAINGGGASGSGGSTGSGGATSSGGASGSGGTTASGGTTTDAGPRDSGPG